MGEDRTNRRSEGRGEIPEHVVPQPPQRPPGTGLAAPSPPPPPSPPPRPPSPTASDASAAQPAVVPIVALEARWVLATGVTALAADLALRRPPWNNLAATLLIVLAAVGLASAGRSLNRQQMGLLVGASVFGVFLSVRTDPRLVAFNLAAALGLVVLASLRGLSLADLRLTRVLTHGLEVVGQPFALLSNGVDQYRARAQRRSSSRTSTQLSAVARGLAIGGPLIVLLGLLLASADAVFASFFSTTLVSPGAVIGHGVLLTVGGVAMATAIGLSHRDQPEPDVALPTLGRTETLTILGSLNLLFALFVVAQIVARSDSGGAVLEAGGLSYKEYARQGFFQLLWVAGITLAVLVVLRTWTRQWSGTDRWFKGLAVASIALTMVIVAVAFSRLQLYIDDNGLTPLRFYSSAFSVWIGIAFVLVAGRMLGWWPDRNWMLSALVGSGLVALFVLNVLNPERVIAENLLERGDAPILWHMEKLTGDGRAVLADGADRLPADMRVRVVDRLCDDRSVTTGDDVLDWNLGQARERDALARLCTDGGSES